MKTSNDRFSFRGSARAAEVIASEWLVRQGEGLDPTEQREFDRWLAADPSHTQAFNRLNATEALFERAKQKGLTDTVLERYHARVRKRRAFGLKLSVVLVIGTLALPTFLWRDRLFNQGALFPRSNTIAFEPIRRLPDGTVAELKTNAEISVNYSPTVRRVRLLRGEAHFLVEKDPSRPFVVEVGALGVRAVGTSFAVSLRPDSVDVVVTEGRVAVDKRVNDRDSPVPGGIAIANGHAVPASGATTLALVDAGHELSVATDQPDFPSKWNAMTEAQIKARLDWRLLRVKFRGMPLGEAVALINRANGFQIVLADDSIRKLRISGIFDTHNPEGFARILAATFDLRAESFGTKEIVLRMGTVTEIR
ncbi:MAG: FecR domain-containing protein [Opitutaceae bacterium]